MLLKINDDDCPQRWYVMVVLSIKPPMVLSTLEFYRCLATVPSVIHADCRGGLEGRA